MADVDHVAVEDDGLGLFRTMENAGRALAWHVKDVRDEEALVVAGNGGNIGPSPITHGQMSRPAFGRSNASSNTCRRSGSLRSISHSVTSVISSP